MVYSTLYLTLASVHLFAAVHYLLHRKWLLMVVYLIATLTYTVFATLTALPQSANSIGQVAARIYVIL